VRKVAELAAQHFLADDRLNVRGIVIAGSANLKNDLQNSDLFDKRINSAVVASLDVSYGFDNGLNQAITLAADAL